MLSENKLASLLSILSKITRINDLRSIASITEQILFSGSNLLISLVVVIAAGVAEFGIYSFIFSMTILSYGLNTSLIHRQMVLHSSSESETDQNQNFLNSIILNFCLFLLICLITVGSYWVYRQISITTQSYWILISATLLYIYVYNLYDICKLFLYVKDKQIYSLSCSIAWISSTLALIALVLLFSKPNYVVLLTFLSMTAGFVVALSFNSYCRNLLAKTKWKGVAEVKYLAMRYWEQGKFAGLGATATWVKTQGLNPTVILLAGPLISGYLNLARLFVMPITTINQGLINSSTPSLRRSVKTEGFNGLVQKINIFSRIIFSFTLLYMLLILFLHLSGLLERVIVDYAQLTNFLIFWFIFVCIALVRFWLSQFFIVTLDLKYVLYINLLASGIVITGALLSYFAFKSHLPILLSMILSEVFCTTMMYLQRQKRINA